jgi:hypothetical protein
LSIKESRQLITACFFYARCELKIRIRFFFWYPGEEKAWQKEAIGQRTPINSKFYTKLNSP